VKKLVSIRFPPVIKFLLRINFNDIENPTIQTLTQISDKLSEEGYSLPTKINLISSKGPDPQLIFTPIRFLSEEVGNEISIFRDSIFFNTIKNTVHGMSKSYLKFLKISSFYQKN